MHAQVQNLRDVLGKARLLGEAPDAAQLKALVDGGSQAADDYNRFANMASGIIAQLAKAGGWFQTNICNTVWFITIMRRALCLCCELHDLFVSGNCASLPKTE